MRVRKKGEPVPPPDSPVARSTRRTGPVELQIAVPTRRKSRWARIPSPVRFVLVVLMSLVLSSALFTATAEVTLGDLGVVSKHLEEWWEVGGLMAWKALELGLAWTLGFDARDMASFMFLTHLPTYMLLSSFYEIRNSTVLTAFAITLVSTAIPFALLRRPTSVHDLSHAPSAAVANRSILQDRPTAVYTTLAATSIYAVVLYVSYATWLPQRLVTHFENIPTIAVAHAGPAGLPVLFLSLIPAGWATRDFLFVSSTGSSSTSQRALSSAASASSGDEGEYLITTLRRRTWARLSRKTQVLVFRTAILAASVVLNTVIQLAGTVRGVDWEGATAWGSIWAVATCVAGMTFGWIEAVDGV